MSLPVWRRNRVAKALLRRLREEAWQRVRDDMARRGVLERFDKSSSVGEMLRLVYPPHPIPSFSYGKLTWKDVIK